MTRHSPTLSDLYRDARGRLRDAGADTPELDARLLLEHAAGVAHTDLIADPGRAVEPGAASAFETVLARRLRGEPVYRILGHRDFYGMRLRLSPGTLEPRPDTETLIEAVLPFLRGFEHVGAAPRILDLGTGTGAIALALLREVPAAFAVGVDISDDALATASANALDLGLAARFQARKSDWFSQVEGKFHAIVSNPPYISSVTVRQLPREVREHDPLAALDGGEDGLDAYRVIATQAENHLEGDGIVAIEIGYDQMDAVTRLFAESGFTLRKSGFDLQRHPRALVLSRS